VAVVVAVAGVVAGGGSCMAYKGKIRLLLEVFFVGQILGAHWKSSSLIDESLSFITSIVLGHCSCTSFKIFGNIGKCFPYLGVKSRVQMNIFVLFVKD